MINWELVSEIDLNDGGGPYSEANFESLTLDTTYMVVCKHLKHDTNSTNSILLRWKNNTTELSMNGYSLYDGHGASLDSAASRSAGGGGSAGDPVGGFSSPSDDMFYESDTAVDEHRGTTIYSLFRLKDQGTTDNNPWGSRGVWLGGGMDSTIRVCGWTESQLSCVQTTPANTVNGMRIYVAAGNFAAIAGAKISLYKYTGSNRLFQ